MFRPKRMHFFPWNPNLRKKMGFPFKISKLPPAPPTGGGGGGLILLQGDVPFGIINLLSETIFRTMRIFRVILVCQVKWDTRYIITLDLH